MSIDICKICKRLKIYTNITRFMLILKHLIFFIRAFIQVVFKDRLFLNLLVLLLFFLINILKIQEPASSFIYGALFSILVTANLESSANLYKKEIIWDGDWAIIEYEKYNFEHKKGIYISVYGELTNVIIMIARYFHTPYVFGRCIGLERFNEMARRLNLWRFQQDTPDFNRLDADTAFNRFNGFYKSFYDIDNVIESIQSLLNHINEYCPNFNVKSAIAIFLVELFNTKYYVDKLKIFIDESSPEDDANRWNIRLQELRDTFQINTGALDNNIRNIVISLYIIYQSIESDYCFDNLKGKN